ncbi:MAG: hypothetical protein MJA31_11900 [Clostridia bacterium]|nr:hypothetical protein [Clostridia bacterium]
MSKYIDLGLLVKDPLIFKLGEDEYTIPGQISTKLVLKLSHYDEKIKDQSNDEIMLEMQKMVLEILSLDKSKTLTLEDIQDKFDDVRFLKAIVNGFQEHIEDITNDPN